MAVDRFASLVVVALLFSASSISNVLTVNYKFLAYRPSSASSAPRPDRFAQKFGICFAMLPATLPDLGRKCQISPIYKERESSALKFFESARYSVADSTKLLTKSDFTWTAVNHKRLND
jgi:hypothetical protein